MDTLLAAARVEVDDDVETQVRDVRPEPRPVTALRAVTERRTPTREDRERRLAVYFEDHVASGADDLGFLVHHPVRALTALVDLCSQPRLVARPSDDVEGRALRTALERPSRLGRTIIHSATAVLVLPERASDYALGSSKQTLRRKVRKAQAAGVRWAEVDDPAERRRLVELAERQERTHPLEQYRRDDPDNSFLLDYRLWLAAYAADGRPLHLSVTPVDGEWASLTYFRTLGSGQQQSDARYLVHQALVERLVERGVRYLVDVSSPAHLSNGCRHFQRMLGFRIVRVALKRPRG